MSRKKMCTFHCWLIERLLISAVSTAKLRCCLADVSGLRLLTCILLYLPRCVILKQVCRIDIPDKKDYDQGPKDCLLFSLKRRYWSGQTSNTLGSQWWCWTDAQDPGPI